MFKKLIALLLVIVLALGISACAPKKLLHCDGCGAEIEVDAKSNIEEDWIVFCHDCEEQIGPILSPG